MPHLQASLSKAWAVAAGPDLADDPNLTEDELLVMNPQAFAERRRRLQEVGEIKAADEELAEIAAAEAKQNENERRERELDQAEHECTEAVQRFGKDDVVLGDQHYTHQALVDWGKYLRDHPEITHNILKSLGRSDEEISDFDRKNDKFEKLNREAVEAFRKLRDLERHGGSPEDIRAARRDFAKKAKARDEFQAAPENGKFISDLPQVTEQATAMGFTPSSHQTKQKPAINESEFERSPQTLIGFHNALDLLKSNSQNKEYNLSILEAQKSQLSNEERPNEASIRYESGYAHFSKAPDLKKDYIKANQTGMILTDILPEKAPALPPPAVKFAAMDME